MKAFALAAVVIIASTVFCQEEQPADSIYNFHLGDPYGSGKWYMKREIALVMGYSGIEWLERDEREKEENTSRLIKNLNLKSTDVVADIGAGSGFYTFKIAAILDGGKVFALDIQDEMLKAISERKKALNINNIELVKTSEKSVNLKSNSVDKVLMVDVYHEFSFPREMMLSIADCLKKDGQVYLVEYRKEDNWVPIKEVHKMTEKQAEKEMNAVGFEMVRNIGNLPWQHCMVFRKK